MTTTNKLDLRTCPIEELCEWVAREILGHPMQVIAFYDYANKLHRSLDAVAAVERKARERSYRMNPWGPIVMLNGTGTWDAEWCVNGGRMVATAPTEPEARLRAVALAWEAEKEGR